jgi:hypothetical protein
MGRGGRAPPDVPWTTSLSHLPPLIIVAFEIRRLCVVIVDCLYRNGEKMQDGREKLEKEEGEREEDI